MGESARVESIEALEVIKRALWKFSEVATVALGDAESDMQRTLIWLESEQRTYWRDQIRKRQDLVVRAAEAVRSKKLFKDSTGATPSAVDEEKALALAKRRLEEAQQKELNVKKYVPILQKEIQNFKGSIQRFATTVQVDIPAAVHQLTGLLIKLEEYVELKGPDTGIPNATPTTNESTQTVAPAPLTEES
jgi:hypothetical protein